MIGKASSKSRHQGIQLTLREVVSLDPTDHLKAAMQEALKGCNMSRAQVVEDINRILSLAGMKSEGRPVTEAVLDKWVARGARSHLIPLRLLPVFCQATRSILPLQAIMPPGAEVVYGEDLAFLRWAKVEVERKKLSREARKLAQEAGIQ